MLKRTAFLLIVVSLLVVVPLIQAQDDGSTVYAQLTADYDKLDPHLTNNSLGYQMTIMFYDRLVALDDDGNVIPSLATKWEGSGADSLKFWLNPDATCADGTPVTPEVVANSLLRMGADATASPYMYRTLGGVAGDTERRYTVDYDNAEGTVTINMVEPFSGLLIGLSMPWASIVCPAGIENPDSMVDTPQGSGPYVLEQALRGDRYVLKARPEYTWGARGTKTSDPGFPQTVVFQVVPSETTAVNMFMTGELNLITASGPDLARLESEQGLFTLTGYNFGAYWLQMNQTEGLVGTDPLVRQAVYMAISRDDYNQIQYFGRAELASSFISSKIVCYDPSTEPLLQDLMGYDPKAAQELLINQDGYELHDDGKLYKDGNPLTLRFVESVDAADSAEYIILQLEDLGATVESSIVDFGGKIEALFTTGEWDVTVLPYGPPVPLPSAVMAFLSGTTATNTGHIHNDKFDKEAALANSTAGDESCQHWGAAQRALLENFDYKPLVVTTTEWFGKGVEFTLYNGYIGTFDPITLRIVNQ